MSMVTHVVDVASELDYRAFIVQCDGAAWDPMEVEYCSVSARHFAPRYDQRAAIAAVEPGFKGPSSSTPLTILPPARLYVLLGACSVPCPSRRHPSSKPSVPLKWHPVMAG